MGNLDKGPWIPWDLTLTPSKMSSPLACRSRYSDFENLVKPHLLLVTTLYLPGNLFLDLLKASRACTTFCSLHLMEYKGWPILTLAHFSMGFPKAPLIPAWSLSAPAQESILLILMMCQGCTLHLMWKPSLPAFLDMYLLAAIRAASRALEEIYSFSHEMMCTE